MTNKRDQATKRRSRGSAERCETHLSDRLDQQAATICITDPSALVALARDAPVLAAREAQIAMTTLETGFQKHRVGLIGAAYASAYYMIRTDGAWEKFLKDAGWADLTGKPKNTLRARNNMLLHVLRYVFRAEGNNARRRVRVYAGMLQDRFDKSFKPEGAIPLIDSRGIEELRKEGVALRKAVRAQAPRDKWLDGLNALADDEPEPAPMSPIRPGRKLTPARIHTCVALLETFNAAMLRYLSDQAKGATPPRRRDPTGAGHGREGRKCRLRRRLNAKPFRSV